MKFLLFVDSYKRLHDFSVLLSNDSAIDENNHQCAYHHGHAAASTFKTLPCVPPQMSRYVKIKNGNSHTEADLFSLCEVVVMGYKSVGRYFMISCPGFGCILLLFVYTKYTRIIKLLFWSFVEVI